MFEAAKLFGFAADVLLERAFFELELPLLVQEFRLGLQLLL